MTTFKEFLTEAMSRDGQLTDEKEIQRWLTRNLTNHWNWKLENGVVNGDIINIYNEGLAFKRGDHNGYLMFQFGTCNSFNVYTTNLSSLKGSPLKVTESYAMRVHNDRITTLEGITPQCPTYVLTNLEAVSSLKDIHKQIKSALILDLPRNVTSNILGILMIKNLSVLHNPGNKSSSSDIGRAIDIVKRHLDADRDILDCQEELRTAGLREFGKL